ncbi:ribonuclease M5 [Schleiferilactobacillus harbinensis]|jgi:ribonuclease M5|uniref:Ribonuclease M5 n=2 Tax=Schleiferilactobacillus harbinensis TaxID=304207 RepID=A0A510U0W1_9LACO|nr:ribonuclease M5 [Schleiferilactobacillus harbinensis]KRM28151.1 primase-like protein [Schleiferilactobacillus harbinensis DSM 16991]MBO3092665.1 ribonuclease M5 [Schleiferilactobacillus harbinensis]MCI1687553.1 ribonuclease M5 [Schleiferilactobacillus harbinensis]MCI1784470.1 ribonuclease M5 [Schleiferilactobacillus harbinensis]MCI1851150.1 ribonuclease M5 [Schleiferilactobacillus harbinensis]
MIKEVIIVEGRDDTKRLQEALGPVDTIETHGFALPPDTLAAIKEAQAKRGIIIFTDPDHPGEKIRRQILAAVPDAKQAFLPRQAGIPVKQGTIGVEHASNATIRAALAQVYTPVSQPNTADPVTEEDLLHLGLTGTPNAAALRNYVADTLHLGHVNGKQLLKRLHAFAITPAQLGATVRAWPGTDRKDTIHD